MKTLSGSRLLHQEVIVDAQSGVQHLAGEVARYHGLAQLLEEYQTQLTVEDRPIDRHVLHEILRRHVGRRNPRQSCSPQPTHTTAWLRGRKSANPSAHF